MRECGVHGAIRFFISTTVEAGCDDGLAGIVKFFHVRTEAGPLARERNEQIFHNLLEAVKGPGIREACSLSPFELWCENGLQILRILLRIPKINTLDDFQVGLH